MHNIPGMEVGTFAVKAGPMMAGTSEFDITVHGRGGHAAMAYQTVDPILVASEVVGALQSIASRNTHPLDSVVVSATQIHAGDAYNEIGRAHVCTPVTNAHLVCRLLLEKKKTSNLTHMITNNPNIHRSSS